MRDIKIIYEGVNIYPEISVHSCFHDMYAEKRSDELVLRMNDTRFLWDIWNPKHNDIISIENEFAETGKMYIENVTPENGLTTLRAFSAPQTTKDKTNKSWEKVNFIQLAQEIAERHDLGFEQYGINDRLYEYVVQNNIPDFLFLQERCVLEGAAFLVYNGKLVLYDESFLENQAPADIIEVTRENDFQYRNDDIKAYGKSEIVNGKFKGTYNASNDCTKTLRRIVPVYIEDQDEADRFAKGFLRNVNKDMTAVTIWYPIARDFAAASVVNLSTVGEPSWDGAAFITHVRHDYVLETSKIFFRKPLKGY